jgi:hypothetical protein
MSARSRGVSPLRPSGLPEVVERLHTLLRCDGADPAAVRASTEDLRRIDMMITANEDRA